jgi:hypothetical protein
MTLDTRKGDSGIFDTLFAWIEQLRSANRYPYGLYELVFAIEAVLQDINNEECTRSVTRRLEFWKDLVDSNNGLGEDVLDAFQISLLQLLEILGSWRSQTPEGVLDLIESIRPLTPKNYISKTGINETDLSVSIAQVKLMISMFRECLDTEKIRLVQFVDRARTQTTLPESFLDYFSTIYPDSDNRPRRNRFPVSYQMTKSTDRSELIADPLFIWDIKLTFTSAQPAAAGVAHCLWAISSALEAIDGVAVELSDWSRGSFVAKLKVYIKNIWARDEVRQVLQKGRDAVESHYLDRPMEEVAKNRAEREKIEEDTKSSVAERERMPDKQQSRESNDLDIEKKRQEVRAQKLDNDLKQIEVIRLTSQLVRDGIVSADKVTIDINELGYLLVDGSKCKRGVEMSAIEDARVKLRDTSPPASESDIPPAS